MKYTMQWQIGYSDTPDVVPAERVPAAVPGAVQLDWAAAKGWESYTYADNWKQYTWMEDKYWSYKCELEPPALKTGERLYLVFGGIDYKFRITLDGDMLHEQEGMFTPVELDITDTVHKVSVLEVLIFPVPKRPGAAEGREQADQCCKPAVSYGWDWHPRLIPLGIWEEAYLEVRHTVHIRSAELLYDLSQDLSKACMRLAVELSAVAPARIHWRMFDRRGKLVLDKSETTQAAAVVLEAELDRPELWWPNGEGEPVLYTSEIELTDAQGNSTGQRTLRTGFRRVELVMHPGAWNHPDGFPKSRSHPPITMEINGRRIFCKGTNWVNPEIFPGLIDEGTYRPLLELAKGAHMNLLRSWGGGIINKEAFFELCDVMGLMVWQEFPLACNNYRGTPGYLKVLDQESRSIIRRLRGHACVVMWCGGNELFNGWSGMTDQSPALRLLNRNCYELDPDTPFLMTSPLEGMAHGNYLFLYHNGEEVFQAMARAKNTAYTEFGCPGPSPAEYLRTFIPESELFPPRPGTAWQDHHAFHAWFSSSWLLPEVQEHYFGKAETLEELVERGELLQCEGYKCIYEEARRQKPVCSMALNWCYNEPWPTAANNSLVNWPAKPKPAYYAVQASCRPILASARIPKFRWEEGEVFSPEVWLLNDHPEVQPGNRIVVELHLGNESIRLLEWEYPETCPNTNTAGPVIRYILPAMKADRMKLVLKVPGRPELNSEYVLLYKAKTVAYEAPKPRTLNM